MICDICVQTIFHGGALRDTLEGHQREHHPNLNSFHASVTARCYICNVLWYELSDDDREALGNMPSDGNSIRFYYQLAFRESIHELNDEAVSHLSIFVRLFNANIGFEQYPMATAEFGLRPLVCEAQLSKPKVGQIN